MVVVVVVFRQAVEEDLQEQVQKDLFHPSRSTVQ